MRLKKHPFQLRISLLCRQSVTSIATVYTGGIFMGKLGSSVELKPHPQRRILFAGCTFPSEVLVPAGTFPLGQVPLLATQAL